MNKEPSDPISPINKTMDRDDLLSSEGAPFVSQLSQLAQELEERRLPITSWYGGLFRPGFELSLKGMRSFIRRRFGRTGRIGPTAEINRGADSYEPVPGIQCDDLHPWFLYWEAFWVMSNGPNLRDGARILDAGGTASLFSYYLAAQGHETRSVDLNKRLAAAGDKTARAMNWNLHSYCMDMTHLEFGSGHFDHAYSLCVMQHLDSDTRKKALREIGRVLKAGGILSLTFDYGAPGVFLCDGGFNYEPDNQIRTPDDVCRHFISCPLFEPMGNLPFEDIGKTYLSWPPDPSNRYTFGAVFLRRV